MYTKLLLVSLSVVLGLSLSAMEQDRPHKKQKIEDTAQPALHQPLSLRNVCLSYINHTNAHQSRVQNDTMALLGDPRIADHSLKHEIIKQLHPQFIDMYETNLADLIKDNILIEQNQALLMSKLPSNVIDEQLSDLIFGNSRSDALRALLISRLSPTFIEKNIDKLDELFIDENTPHLSSCALFSQINPLQTINNIFVLAKNGKITPQIAQIAAQQFNGEHFFDKELYQSDMLNHGNEQLFTEAHMQLLLDQISKYLVIKELKDSSTEDFAHVKLYGSDKETFHVKLNLINSRLAVMVTKGEQLICQYDCDWFKELEHEQAFDRIDHIVSLDQDQKHCAIVRIFNGTPIRIIDIVRLSDSKRIVSIIIHSEELWSKLSWSADGKRLIMSSQNNKECKTIGTSYKLIHGCMNLKNILVNRFSLLHHALSADERVIRLKELNKASNEILNEPSFSEKSILTFTEFIDTINRDNYKDIKNRLKKLFDIDFFNELKQSFLQADLDQETAQVIHTLIEKIEQFEKEDQQNQ